MLKGSSECFLYRGSIGIKSVGVTPGNFVVITQGNRRDDGTILHSGDSSLGSVDEYFRIYESEPRCLPGTGVYLVRKDGTLLVLRENWDTSD
jgi:hypothetical protein